MYTIVLSLLLLLSAPFLFPAEFSVWCRHVRQRLEEREEERIRKAADLARDAEGRMREIRSRVERHRQELAAIRSTLVELEHQAP